jgi:hypothetical protein
MGALPTVARATIDGLAGAKSLLMEVGRSPGPAGAER